MGFINTRFPTGLSYSTKGGPRNPAFVSDSDGGIEHVVNRYVGARHEFDVEYFDRSDAEIAELLTFFMICEGPLLSFRFKDWNDFTTSDDHVGAVTPNILIAQGDGSQTDFQLLKYYQTGSNYITRVITKPVIGTVVVLLDGVPTTDFDVNYELGLIYFVSAPALNVLILAGCEFDVPVRFADNTLSISKEAHEGSEASTIKLIEVETDAASSFSRDLWTSGHNGGSDIYTVVSGSPAKTLYGHSPKYLHVVNTVASNATVYLPPKASLQGGGPQFIISNDAGSLDHVHIRDIDTVTTIISIAADRTAVFWMSKNGTWSYMEMGY